jgi:transcription elongation factor Elf1
MSAILGQSEPQAQPQVFACPKCGEMTNASTAQCGNGNGPVDSEKPKGLKNTIN